MKLQELAPTGYENVEYFITDMEAVMGEFCIKILNKNGGTAKDINGKNSEYYFNRSYDSVEGVWLDDSLWTYLDGSEPEKEIIFDNGDGLWLYVSPDAYVEGTESYSIQNAGEAFLDSGSVLLREGNRGVVAPLSAGVPLQKIAPTGYENVEYFITDMEAVMGEFCIKILNKNGGTAQDINGKNAEYYFNRSYDSVEGVWLDDSLWTYLDGSVPEKEISFDMGEGLWVYVSPDAYPDGSEIYYLQFPGIDDLAD